MKKIILSFSFIIFCTGLFAKKVKFAVDMTGQIINITGVHVIGDFQDEAGFGPDWDPATLSLTQEGTTDIYSVIVNIPAFRKYDYKFVNGDLSYEVEFVPDHSQVGYEFNDNRWLYLDSLANDTSFFGAILFGGNAPMGKSLLRYKVDLTTAGPNVLNGIHVANSANSFSPSKEILYSFGDSIYEIINYFNTGSLVSYKFVNGKITTNFETVPTACATSGNRTVSLVHDSVLPIVCFASCVACVPVSVKEISKNISTFKLFPNPANNNITITSSANDVINKIEIQTITGQKLTEYSNLSTSSLNISDLNLNKGFYFITVSTSQNKQHTIKLIIE